MSATPLVLLSRCRTRESTQVCHSVRVRKTETPKTQTRANFDLSFLTCPVVPNGSEKKCHSDIAAMNTASIMSDRNSQEDENLSNFVCADDTVVNDVGEQWAVDRVVGDRFRNNRLELCFRWKGFSSKHDSWLLWDDTADTAPIAIQEYMERANMTWALPPRFRRRRYSALTDQARSVQWTKAASLAALQRRRAPLYKRRTFAAAVGPDAGSKRRRLSRGQRAVHAAQAKRSAQNSQ